MSPPPYNYLCLKSLFQLIKNVRLEHLSGIVQSCSRVSLLIADDQADNIS